jgi:hypothetical protein
MLSDVALNHVHGGDAASPISGTPITLPLGSINWVLVRPQPDPWRLGTQIGIHL